MTPPDHKILIVDQDHLARRYIRGMLSELGYRAVDEASSESQALERIGQDMQPDTIIASWDKENGPLLFDMIAGIQQAGKTLPVIVVSEKTDMASIMRARQAGVHAYLAKPFTLAQLRSKLTHTLQ